MLTLAADSYQGDIGQSVQVYQYHIVLNKRVQVQVQVDFWTWKGPEGECFWIQGYSEEGVSDGIYLGNGKDRWKIRTKIEDRDSFQFLTIVQLVKFMKFLEISSILSIPACCN